ncbi:ester cyclase [Streptomyces sp. GLT-R25]
MSPGLSNCRVQVDDLFAAEDRVVTAFTLTYTHDRTGRDLTMSGIKSYRLSEGRIVEFWGETDLYSLLRQLGLVPEEIPALLTVGPQRVRPVRRHAPGPVPRGSCRR